MLLIQNSQFQQHKITISKGMCFSKVSKSMCISLCSVILVKEDTLRIPSEAHASLLTSAS